MKFCARVVTVSLLLAGCGGDPATPVDQTTTREIQVPLLRTVAPSSIRAGDELTVFGANFADDQIGEARLTFDGYYQTTAGQTEKVNLEVTPKFKNQGELIWEFGPNVPFTSKEDTGTFRGLLKVRNVGLDGQIKEAAQPIVVNMQVLPSILIRQFRPAGQGCGAATTATTDNTKMLFEFKAIGLKSGTAVAPMRFIYTFMKESFQFSGYLSNQLSLDPEALFPKTGPVSVVDEIKSGTVSTLGNGVPHNVFVFQNESSSVLASASLAAEKLFGMTNLVTTSLPDAQSSRTAVLKVLAVDSSGSQAVRSLQFTVWTPVEVKYEGGSEVVRTFDPVPVSGCIPGGDIGRDVTYSEQTTDTRQRSFTIQPTVGIEVSPTVMGVSAGRLTAQFGIEVQAVVSSAELKSTSISAKVLPREYGVLYRQTVQLERRATMIGHSGCGSTQNLGDVVVTDWTWSPDLAKGSTCPPFPASNLAKGQQFK